MIKGKRMKIWRSLRPKDGSSLLIGVKGFDTYIIDRKNRTQKEKIE